jgi:hypothetical protein
MMIIMADRQKTNREGQAAYKARMQERGYTQIAVWVKKEHIDKIKEYIKSLNDDDNDGKQ